MEARDYDRRYTITKQMEAEIWEMRCDEGCSQAEIAARLGGTITQSTISRCLKRLMKEYKHKHKEETIL